jgi:DNA-binding transcriptional ArsR family regulator
MDIYAALAEPNRRAILEMLARNGPLTATEIYDQFPISHPAISQHLKVLREANLVLMEKRAQQHIYQINAGAMFELEKWASHLRQLWMQRFDALDAVLEVEKKKIASNDNYKENIGDFMS